MPKRMPARCRSSSAKVASGSSSIAAAIAVRFHLRPAVEAALVEDGGGVRLLLPSGAVWRLRAAGAELGLGESVYLGSGEPRKSQQIVLSGTTGPSGASVRWAIRRESLE